MNRDGGLEGLIRRKAFDGKWDPSVSLLFALALSWFDGASMLFGGPEYRLPFALLSFPRQDMPWLCALLAMSITALVFAATQRFAAKAGESPARRSFVGTAIGGLLMTGGTLAGAFAQGTGSLAGAIASGCGFALLLAACLPVLSCRFRAGERFSTACGALTGAALIELALSLAETITTSTFSAVVRAVFATATAAALGGLSSLLCRGPRGDDSENRGEAGEVPSAFIARTARPTLLSHGVTAVCCLFGMGLFLGIVGFRNNASDGSPAAWLHAAETFAGGFVACLVFLALCRRNHEGAFIAAPLVLGTAAVFLPFDGAVMSCLAKSLGICASLSIGALAVLVALESIVAYGSSPDDARNGRSRLSLAVASYPLFELIGIIVGGVFVSASGVGPTSFGLAAIALLYLAVLVLGNFARSQSNVAYVTVRNPDDVRRIAAAQARAVALEYPSLSPREIEVLELVLHHRNNDQIAEALGISRNTVKTHLAHIFDKTSTGSRRQLEEIASAMTVRL